MPSAFDAAMKLPACTTRANTMSSLRSTALTIPYVGLSRQDCPSSPAGGMALQRSHQEQRTMKTNWNIDAVHSGINFSIRHMVVSKVRGRFAKYTGTVNVDDGDLTRSTVEAIIDASSIDTGTPSRDEHLRSPDFFDVEKFPELRFRSN